jgi:hypothetical protein
MVGNGATNATSDLIVLQYRQTFLETTLENAGRDFFLPHPDSQWLSTHDPVYRLSYDGVPIMEIYSNPTAQTSANTQASESELGKTVQVPAHMQAFKSEAGNFTVQVPANLEFTETTLAVDSAPGISLHIHTSASEELLIRSSISTTRLNGKRIQMLRNLCWMRLRWLAQGNQR